MGGQLALALQALESPQIEMSFYTRAEWDITSIDQTAAILEKEHWDAVINTAAYTAVDLAESEESAAYNVNDKAVAILGKKCKEMGLHLVHVSSDYVYHNDIMRPIKEADPSTPKGVYAKSKLAGELRLIGLECPSTIIRTSWIYSPFGKNFVKTMVKLLRERDQLSVVCDQHGVPTSARDLASMILRLLINRDTMKSKQTSIINYAPKGWTTWYGITKFIDGLLDTHCKIIPIPSNEYPTPAMRPRNSILNCSKFDGLGLGERLDWRVSLEETVKVLASLNK